MPGAAPPTGLSVVLVMPLAAPVLLTVAAPERMTTEYVNGTATRERAGFRAYDSFEQSFDDFVSLLENNDRYRTAIQVASNTGDSERFVKELQKAGYATDPEYASKLSRAIQSAVQSAARAQA